MICPYCGKETEQSCVFSSPTKDITLNLNAGCAQPYTQVILTNEQSIAQPFVPYYELNNACTGAGVMQPVHYVQL